MTKLYIIRHGETAWNIENRTQGISGNQPLNEKGILQARALAERFKALPVDVIYSSDLKRAVETAGEISKLKGLPIHEDSRLREMNFGKWEGLTTSDIIKKYKKIYDLWRTTPMEAIIPDGETLLMLQERVLKLVTEIIKEHCGKNIVIVSHGITCKILILSILGLNIENYYKLRIGNTGLSIIRYSEFGPTIELLNDTCHLGGI